MLSIWQIVLDLTINKQEVNCIENSLIAPLSESKCCKTIATKSTGAFISNRYIALSSETMEQKGKKYLLPFCSDANYARLRRMDCATSYRQ